VHPVPGCPARLVLFHCLMRYKQINDWLIDQIITVLFHCLMRYKQINDWLIDQIITVLFHCLMRYKQINDWSIDQIITVQPWLLLLMHWPRSAILLMTEKETKCTGWSKKWYCADRYDHRRRSSVNFGGDIFDGKYMCEKLTKCPNLHVFLLSAQKMNKIP